MTEVEELKLKARLNRALELLAELDCMIAAAGGVTKNDKGRYVPVGAVSQTDLGKLYIDACRVLHCDPEIVGEKCHG